MQCKVKQICYFLGTLQTDILQVKLLFVTLRCETPNQIPRSGCVEQVAKGH